MMILKVRKNPRFHPLFRRCIFGKTTGIGQIDPPADLGSTETINRCKNNPEKSFITKVGEYIPIGLLMSTISSFEAIGNKHDVYRSKDCTKKFCESLTEHTGKINKFKKMKLLTN